MANDPQSPSNAFAVESVDAMVMKDGATQLNTQTKTVVGAEVELVEMEEVVSAETEDEEAEVAEDVVVVPLKSDDEKKEKEEKVESGDDNGDENEPLLKQIIRERSEEVLSVVREKVIQIEDTNLYSYRVDFVDDLILLVRKKDIFPRLFKLKLAGFLSKILTALLVAVIATGFRLYNGA